MIKSCFANSVQGTSLISDFISIIHVRTPAAAIIIAITLLPSVSQSFAESSIVPPTPPIYILSVPKLIKPCDAPVAACTFNPTRMMVTTFINNDDKPVQFVVFLEVRDSAGVTVFLQFHTGATEGRFGHNTLEMASSWQPEKYGEYELHTFAISNFTKPEVLVFGVAPVDVTIN